MSTCIKCGQDAGFFKVQCSDCFNAAQEDNDPAPAKAQRGDDAQRPKAEYPPQDPKESDDDPQVAQAKPSFGGRFLRFAGMATIVAAILLAVLFGEEPGLLIGLLAVGLAGAAMHYQGRKLAPGKHGASILGGILGGVFGSAAFIIVGLIVVAMFVDGCKGFLGL